MALEQFNDQESLSSVRAKINGNFAQLTPNRVIKPVNETIEYVVVAEDFTESILDFTANGGEEINVTIDSAIVPVKGELQMISTGNNKLVLNLTGVTATYPEQTNPKTILKGWLGGIVVGTNKISFNGSLESTATGGGGIEEAPQDGTPYSRQDAGWVAAATGGGSYSTFTNTEDGDVPAPNVTGETTYSGTITSPTEGFTATEGETTVVTIELPAGVTVTATEVLTSDFTGNTPWKKIDDITRDYIILKSPNGTNYKITVADNGTLNQTAI
jgi:hypothetical protein